MLLIQTGNATFDQLLIIQQNLEVVDDLVYSVEPELQADINSGYQSTSVLKADVEQNTVTLDGEQFIQGNLLFTL